MKVSVRFLGALEDCAGCSEMQADLPRRAVMEDVMVWIGTTFGPRLPAEIWDPHEKRFGPMTMVFLNGEDVEDYRRTVPKGSEVICTTMLAGG